MGTFLTRQRNLKDHEKITVVTPVYPGPPEKSVESNCRLIAPSQKNRKMDFHRPLLVLMLIFVYPLTASYTPENSDPAIQRPPKFPVHEVLDHVTDDKYVVCTTVTQSQVKRTKSDQGVVPKKRETETIKMLNSSDAYKALNSDYSSRSTVEQDLQEDKQRYVFDAINARLGKEGLRY